MIPFQVVSFGKEIDQLVVLADQQTDDEVKSAFARLICVRVSGYVEFSLRTFLTELAEKKSQKAVHTFIQWNIKQFMNPAPDKIFEFLSRFHDGYKKELESVLEDHDDQKEALAAVVALRHKIAHGGSGNIGLQACKTYWALIKDLVESIKKILEKPRRSA